MEHCRLPQWMFGWAVFESVKRHPTVLTAAQTARSLGLSESASLRLKRRVQIFASENMPAMKKLIWKELQKEFRNFEMPPEGTDVSAISRKKKIVHADSMVLFSASQRANKGRKNWKNRGLTASIYMQDRLGGKQIGTLVHVMGTKQGWCLLDSVPDQKKDTLGPIFRKTLPLQTALFTDEGYKWLWGIYRNHRSVNHSERSPDNRFRFSRTRWCKNGVHNQVAEALNSSVKGSFRAYKYFRPEYSQMYLTEWAFFKNLKYFGFENVAKACGDTRGGLTPPVLLLPLSPRRSHPHLRASE